jgi:NAD(P)-dependent dehydrogenase (short-subunit alcohol dehydrogenase family)
VVTGAGRGIGRAISEALAAEGCAVVLAGRRLPALHKVASGLAKRGALAVPVRCDVRDHRSVRGLFQAVRRRFGRLDILINNAGVAHPVAVVEELPPQKWDDVIATNLTGTFLCTREAVPLMRRGGVIVNNLSTASRRPFPKFTGYVASKFGGRGFTNALREELRPRGIRVLGLIPGAVDTDIWEQFWPNAPRDRMIAAGDVARVVLEALVLPANTTVEELFIGPTAGPL